MNVIIAWAVSLLFGCFIFLIMIYGLLSKLLTEAEGIYNRLVDLIKKG